mgnify:CR=1 FL=1
MKRITEDKTKAREVRKKQKTPPQKLIVRIEKKKKEKVLAEKLIVRKIKKKKKRPKKVNSFFFGGPGTV